MAHSSKPGLIRIEDLPSHFPGLEINYNSVDLGDFTPPTTRRLSRSLAEANKRVKSNVGSNELSGVNKSSGSIGHKSAINKTNITNNNNSNNGHESESSILSKTSSTSTSSRPLFIRFKSVPKLLDKDRRIKVTPQVAKQDVEKAFRDKERLEKEKQKQEENQRLKEIEKVKQYDSSKRDRLVKGKQKNSISLLISPSTRIVPPVKEKSQRLYFSHGNNIDIRDCDEGTISIHSDSSEEYNESNSNAPYKYTSILNTKQPTRSCLRHCDPPSTSETKSQPDIAHTASTSSKVTYRKPGTVGSRQALNANGASTRLSSRPRAKSIRSRYRVIETNNKVDSNITVELPEFCQRAGITEEQMPLDPLELCRPFSIYVGDIGLECFVRGSLHSR